MTRTAIIASDSEGQPLMLRLQVRESSTAPARLKLGFTVSTENGLAATDGQKVQPIPSPEDIPGEVMIENEFRVELN